MSIRTERCPTCKGSGLIKVDDWLIKGKTEEELAREKKEALADIVEVVRCKDCEYCHISTDPKTNISVQVCGYVGYNPVQSSQVTDNDYCSHGERREEMRDRLIELIDEKQVYGIDNYQFAIKFGKEKFLK